MRKDYHQDDKKKIVFFVAFLPNKFKKYDYQGGLFMPKKNILIIMVGL